MIIGNVVVSVRVYSYCWSIDQKDSGPSLISALQIIPYWTMTLHPGFPKTIKEQLGQK